MAPNESCPCGHENFGMSITYGGDRGLVYQPSGLRTRVAGDRASRQKRSAQANHVPLRMMVRDMQNCQKSVRWGNLLHDVRIMRDLAGPPSPARFFHALTVRGNAIQCIFPTGSTIEKPRFPMVAIAASCGVPCVPRIAVHHSSQGREGMWLESLFETAMIERSGHRACLRF